MIAPTKRAARLAAAILCALTALQRVKAAEPETPPQPAPPQEGATTSPPPVSSSPVSPPPVAPPPAPPRYLLDRLAAGASLGYFTSSPDRILSEMHFDFPFVVVREKSLYVRGRLETSTVKTGEEFEANSFQAQDIDYLAEFGARDYLNNRIAVAAFVGQQGREQLDESGSASVRYFGLGLESAGFPRPGANRIEWRLALGATFHHEGVEADAVARGAVLYDLWKGSRNSIGLDASFDTLFDGSHGQTEYRAGPRWTVPLANGIRADVFAEWIRGRNPLLLADSEGWNLGFRYAEGAYAGPHEHTLPDVRGVLAAGRGSRRGFGRFDLDLSSPEISIFSRPGRIFANLDANVVAGTGVDNLYYIATAGVEASVSRRIFVGPSVYHRSNHTMGEGPTDSTSLNIVQVVARTEGWDYLDRSEGRLFPDGGASWLDRLEAILAPGIVTSSSFDDSTSWDVQAGARFDLISRDARIVPFVRAFSEWGDVDRREAAIGISTRQNLILEIRYRRDTQYFGEDLSDVFFEASLYF